MNFIKSSQLPNYSEEIYHPNESDSLTLITAVREEFSDAPKFFTLLRISPISNKIAIAVIPCEIMVEDAGKFDSAANVWKREGAKRASDAIGNALSVSIDRWLDLDKSGLIKLTNTIGTVDYLLEEPLLIDEMQIFNSGRQIFDGQKISSVCFSGEFDENRLYTINSIAAETARQRIAMINPPDAELIFNSAVNLGKSSMTISDLELRRNAILKMLEETTEVHQISASGSYNEAKNTFLPSAAFLEALKNEFK